MKKWDKKDSSIVPSPWVTGQSQKTQKVECEHPETGEIKKIQKNGMWTGDGLD